jgi:itaconyl-CoA hydratase
MFATERLTSFKLSELVEQALAEIAASHIAGQIEHHHPLFAGDTLYAQSEVLDKRESNSRPNAGIVTVKTVGLNQDGVEVCDFKRTILVMKREGADLEARAIY